MPGSKDFLTKLQQEIEEAIKISPADKKLIKSAQSDFELIQGIGRRFLEQKGDFNRLATHKKASRIANEDNKEFKAYCDRYEKIFGVPCVAAITAKHSTRLGL